MAGQIGALAAPGIGELEVGAEGRIVIAPADVAERIAALEFDRAEGCFSANPARSLAGLLELGRIGESIIGCGITVDVGLAIDRKSVV